MNEVTLVITSCGRPDLLDRTINSFLLHNTYPIQNTIIIEDGPALTISQDLSNINIIINKERKGQVYSIDKAYSYVTTPFIFHCEDDWEFYKSGFIERSLEILTNNGHILQAWLREQQDTNGHPVEKREDLSYDLMALDWGDKWHGFSWNPGLRRLSDYKTIDNYSKYQEETLAIGTEAVLNKIYKDLGFRAAILREGYVKHIGEGRHIS
jgi:hypothetical protein